MVAGTVFLNDQGSVVFNQALYFDVIYTSATTLVFNVTTTLALNTNSVISTTVTPNPATEMQISFIDKTQPIGVQLASVTSAQWFQANSTLVIYTLTTTGIVLVSPQYALKNSCWSWSSGTGPAGQVCVLDNYIFASNIQNTVANLFFDLTGITGNSVDLPNLQLKIQVWNTTNTGKVPIVIQTGSISPTYITNLLNYSYVNPNITCYAQLSNKTVTVDFNSLGGLGIKIPYSTASITTAPAYSNLLLTVTTSQGSGTVTQVSMLSSSLQAPVSVGLTSGQPAVFSYDANTKTLTLTGAGSYVIAYPSGGSSNSPSGQTTATSTASSQVSAHSTPSSGLSAPFSFANIQLGSLYPPTALVMCDASVPLTGSAAQSISIQYWVTDSTGVTVMKNSIVVTLTGAYPSQSATSAIYPIQIEISKSGSYIFNAIATNKAGLQTTTREPFTVLDWQLYATEILVGIVVVCVIGAIAVALALRKPGFC